MRKFKEPTTYCQFVLVAVERQKFLQMYEGHFVGSDAVQSYMKKLDWLNKNLPEYKKNSKYTYKIYEHKWKKYNNIRKHNQGNLSKNKNTEMEIVEKKLKLENQSKRSNIQLIPEKE